MKTFNYIVSMIMAVLTVVCFIYADSDLWVMLAFVIMQMSMIFFLFALVEERNEKIEELRNKIYQSFLNNQ